MAFSVLLKGVVSVKILIFILHMLCILAFSVSRDSAHRWPCEKERTIFVEGHCHS